MATTCILVTVIIIGMYEKIATSLHVIHVEWQHGCAEEITPTLGAFSAVELPA